MNYDPMGALTEWHEAVGEKPARLREGRDLSELAQLRIDMLDEESEEACKELDPLSLNQPGFSRARLAAELADVLYIVYGTAQLFEIDLPKVFEAVHRKNMEKIDPETGRPFIVLKNGKVGKPEGFKPLTETEIYEILNSD